MTRMTSRREATVAAAPLWQAGWYRFARRLESPNFGARPPRAAVDLIVVHSISLPPGEYGGPQVLQLFTNTLDWSAHPYFESIRGMEVSAHFFIRRNGELWQMVSCDARAWHAGRSQYGGRDNRNDDSIGIELEGLEGQGFETPQYETLTAICAALAGQYPVAHVAGHEHIAPGRKNDPGAGFNWPALQQSLGWAPECFPEATIPRRKV
jgi:N-acetyl-anhydromuramoyl-L-alanine amidase